MYRKRGYAEEPVKTQNGKGFIQRLREGRRNA